MLKRIHGMFPDLAPSIDYLLDRLMDLLPLMRAHYYHPAMRGSWSIKKVLPTIAPHLDYAELDEIQEGGAAQMAYLELIAPRDRAGAQARTGGTTPSLLQARHARHGRAGARIKH